MSYTPLNLNAMGSLLQNQGLRINPDAVTYMGSSTSVSNYTKGSIGNLNGYTQLISAIRAAYQLLQTGDITNQTYTNLISIGSTTIPALGNSKPSTYTRTYTGEITSYGFLRLIPLQAYNSFHINDGSYSDFVRTFSNCYNSSLFYNEAIKAMHDSSDYLDGIYSNMNDLITNDITGVNVSTLYWGQDLIKTGKVLDLSNIDVFGNPAVLLRTIYKNNAVTKALNLALMTQDITSTELNDIYLGKEATPLQQSNIYTAFLLITGVDLSDVLTPLNCQTIGLKRLSDLLNPVKLFPDSYMSLTVPEYNVEPKPTNSKTYHLLYDGSGGVNKKFNYGSRLKNILPDDIAYAADAFSYSMMQIKNIKSMNIEKFSQVVTNLEPIADLTLNNTNIPTNQSIVKPAYNILAKGTTVNGTYNMCDYFGSMTNIHYDHNILQKNIQKLMSTTLVNIYTSINSLVSGSAPYTNLQTLIDDANTEIASIKANNLTVSNTLNTLYSQFGEYLQKEQDARELALGTDLSQLDSNNGDIIAFIQSILTYAQATEQKGPAIVLENICDTTTIGGKSIIGSMREARNQIKLGLTGAELDNKVAITPLVLPPVTGTISSALNVPIVTGAAIVPGSLAGSSETTLVPPNLQIFNTPSNTSAVINPTQAVDHVTTCNCDCWQ